MIIIVTGASKGIGFALAKSLAKEGHRVYGFSRNTVDHPDFESLSVDITEEQQIKKAVEEIYQRHSSIDLLINNAGVGMVGAVEDTTKEDIHRLIDVNLVGSIQMIRAVLPYMRKQKSGRIINISSIGSEMGLPFRGFYSASKSAIDKVTEALRYEVRPWNIEATCLHLGDVKTDIAEGRIRTKISSPYEKIFDKVYRMMNLEVENGCPPEKVAEFILQLLNKNHWKAHYYYGKFIQKMAVPLKWILPQNLYENLLRRYSNMN